ncbi:MAG: CehA/McbA family metallohydrolase [Myxococcota bacterium]
MCLLLGLASSAAAAALRAERITESNARRLIIGGPDAIGGVGDWYLANDVVEVIVDDPGRRYATLNHGGTIVDAGLRDRTGEDQFARLFPLLNMDLRVFLNYDTIEATLDEAGGWARLVVSSSRGVTSLPRGNALARSLNPLVPEPEALRGVFVETEYAVLPGEPFVHVTTTIRNESDQPAPIFSYGEVWMRGGRSTRSWVGNTLVPAKSAGFHHVSFDRHNILAARDAFAAFTFVSVPGMRQFPPIAYAVFSPERVARNLLQFSVTDDHVTFMNTFLFDPDWKELSLPRLGRAVLSELEPGASWTYRRRLLIAGHPDTAVTTDVIFPLVGYADGGSGVAGRVEPADVPCSIQVDDAATGAPVTQIEPRRRGARAGRYRAVLPPGEYRLTFRAPHRAPRELELTVPAAGFVDAAVQRFEEPGWLVFDPAFADDGPGRITVKGEGDTPDPVFGPELLDFRIDGRLAKSGTEVHELFRVGGGRDPRRVAIAPGRYWLVASRGLEFQLAETRVEVPGAGREVRVPPFSLRRAVDLPGVVSADLHVHGEASDDSGISYETRLRSFVAEGLDVMVATDHDNLGSYEPALDALDLRQRIRVIQGAEVTSSGPSPAAPWTIGHHNTWPVAYRPRAHRHGAPPSQAQSLAALYARLRADFGVQVVQLNHGLRSEASRVQDGAFLSHLGTAGRPFDPTLPIEEPPNDRLLEVGPDGHTRAIDFDAMELMNGADHGQYLNLRAAWYSLLRQGYRRTGTANSDTHGPLEIAAYPRNYVQLPASRRWRQEEFDAAIREGRVVGTTGPLIPRFRANGASMGELALAPAGKVTVEVVVAAAPWVPVEEVRLLVNGEVERSYRDLDAAAVVRFERRVELKLERDAFITVEAGVPLDVDVERWSAERGGLYAVVARGFVPEAFANPIFIDVDGNGSFDPPGLPPVPGGWGAPLVALFALAGAALVAAQLRRRRARSAA